MTDIERWSGDARGRSRTSARRDLVFTVATAPGATVAAQTRAGKQVLNLAPGAEAQACARAGGGSVELTQGTGARAHVAQSLKLGVIRLTEQGIRSDPLSRRDERQMVSHITETMAPTVEKIVSRGFDRVIGTSGTILSLGGLAPNEICKRVDGQCLDHRVIPCRALGMARTGVMPSRAFMVKKQGRHRGLLLAILRLPAGRIAGRSTQSPTTPLGALSRGKVPRFFKPRETYRS